MPWAWWIVLPTSVWVIYTCDHLFDAVKGGNDSKLDRHDFHRRYFKILAILFIAIGIISFWIAAFYLVGVIRNYGIVISCLCVLYLLYSYYFKNYVLPKEVLVAVIYTLGIWFGPMLISKSVISIQEWMLILLTFFTALNNLVLFSIFDQHFDMKKGFDSIAVQFGAGVNRIFNWQISLTCFLICISLYLTSEAGKFFWEHIIFILINSVLLLLYLKQDYFAKKEKYRIIGDGIFILPLLLIFV